MTKAQIDRLGSRLKVGRITEDDRLLLDSYRRSFVDAYGHVVTTITQVLQPKPTGRPTKSTTSVIEKLQRESIRLSQMQDIAGCRIVVDSVAVQSEVVSRLAALFPRHTIVDRRQQPSHGYRAVHLIVREGEKPVEIQIRSRLQHLWAELSEKCSDVVDPAIKYGGGPEFARGMLSTLSNIIAKYEAHELRLDTHYEDLVDTSSVGFGSISGVDREKFGILGQEIEDKLRILIQTVADSGSGSGAS